jgi:hypothetical protein
MAKKKFNTYKAYICSKDALYHIPDDYHGIDIYFSEKSIKEQRKCIGSDDKYGCKIVEIEIKVPVDIED